MNALKSSLTLYLCLAILNGVAFADETNSPSKDNTVPRSGELKYAVIPTDGFVPDESTAIQIATAVWTPIYGKRVLDTEKPFHAKLKDGVWTVEGSLPKGDEGGVALAEISKVDGRIIRVTHGQ